MTRNVFQFPLGQLTEAMLLGEKLSNTQVEKLRTSAKKNIYPSKILKFFLGFFFSSTLLVVSIMFFFSTKSAEKVDNELLE